MGKYRYSYTCRKCGTQWKKESIFPYKYSSCPRFWCGARNEPPEQWGPSDY